MANSISITKRTNGGFTIVTEDYTYYASELVYHGTSVGLTLYSRGLITKLYKPTEWTIQTVSGYTTVEQVCDALDTLGVSSGDPLADMVTLLTTIDEDTGGILTAVQLMDDDLDDARIALQIIDDWDESGRAKVNPIVGQTGVEAGAGKPTLKTQRTLQAKPDYVDITSDTVIYEGYSNGTNYDICKIDLSTDVITREWATGTWANRASLFVV